MLSGYLLLSKAQLCGGLRTVIMTLRFLNNDFCKKKYSFYNEMIFKPSDFRRFKLIRTDATIKGRMYFIANS